MTDLIKELDAVALLADRLDRLSDAVAKQQWNEFSMRVPAEPARDADLVLASVARFIRTHHAEIAEAVKDARRYRALKALTHKDWTVAKDASRGGVFQFTGDDLDAAIDAQHNSAREDGE